jgi:photosystem II stability/assembly factor-like uncharacterized protein
MHLYVRALNWMLLCLATLVPLTTSAGKNIWTSTGPERFDPRCIAFSPAVEGVVFSGGAHSSFPGYAGIPTLYRSFVGGRSWAPTDPNSEMYRVTAIAFDPLDPTTAYACGNGLFKSTDGGATWTKFDNSLFTGAEWYGVTCDPVRRGTVYGCANLGLFKSDNGGGAWSKLLYDGSGSGNWARRLLIDPTNPQILYLQALYADFKSLDGGATWSQILPQGFSLLMNPPNPSVLYYYSGSSFFKSVDGANTWAPWSEGPDSIRTVSIDPTNPSVWYCGTLYAVWKSTDEGRTWFQTSLSAEEQSPVAAIACDPRVPGRLLVAKQGTYLSTDGAETWQGWLSGLGAGGTSYTLADLQLSGVVLSCGNLAQSQDGGTTWANVATNVPPLSGVLGGPLATAPSAPKVWYANGDWRSEDHGQSFTKVGSCASSTAGTLFCMAVHPADPWTVYFGSRYGLFKSTDGAVTCQAVTTGTKPFPPYRLVIDPTDPNTMYASNGDLWGTMGLYKSRDGGATWNAVSPPFQRAPVEAVALDPANPRTVYAGVRGGFGTPATFYKSSDGGNTWKASSKNLPGSGVNAIAIDPRSPKTIYVGTNGNGVFRSVNAGDSWASFNTGLSATTVLSLSVEPVAPGRIYAGTNTGGTFSFELDEDTPLVVQVGKLTDPFRLSVIGKFFTSACMVEVNSVAVPETSYKGPEKLIAKKGDSLKAMVPKGTTVWVTVYNPTSGNRSNPVAFSH